MDLKNGVTKTDEVFIIQDQTTSWYVSSRQFGANGLVHLSFTSERKRADKFKEDESNTRVIGEILETPFDLKVIKLTKTTIEFESEEEINNVK